MHDNNGGQRLIHAAALAATLFPTGSRSESYQLPEAVAAIGLRVVATLHAEGAQIYECVADKSGALSWAFREPVATLIDETGQTIGRHYRGPHWELNDGSLLNAKAAGNAPGASAADIPLLKLAATALSPKGQLANVTVVQRLLTKGGVATGPCEKAGVYKSVAYSAAYVFLAPA